MEIIGVGLSRTGSMSLRYALDDLGFKCYHMEVAARTFSRGDLDLWLDFMEGRTDMDWDAVFDGYEATMDTPPALYFEELYKKYPNAKYILTVRNPDNWYKSLSKLMNMHDTLVEKLQFLPRFKAFQRVYRILESKLKTEGNDQESLINFYNNHNESVKALIPNDQLLVFEVKDGYKPLCDFLGIPAPAEEFPHINAGIEKAEKIMQSMLLEDLIKIFGPWLLVIIAIIIILIVLL
jgi:hypothetical protein